MATGLAIMGFGGGAMIGAPLADRLMNFFAGPASVGVWQTFVVMGALYLVSMMLGAFGYRLPPPGWRPHGYAPRATGNRLMTAHHVHVNEAIRTPQFWLLWGVLCLNVSAGIGVIGMASPMLQEVFGGKLIGVPAALAALAENERARVATIAAAFAGLLSLFNIAGRIFWASLSDVIGRKLTYMAFFLLGIALYVSAPLGRSRADRPLRDDFLRYSHDVWRRIQTILAYLDLSAPSTWVRPRRPLSRLVSRRHRGPVVVNDIREYQLSRACRRTRLITYDVRACRHAVRWADLHLMIQPVSERHFMTAEALAAERARCERRGGTTMSAASASSPVLLFVAWTAIAIPLAWGVWITVTKSLALFR
jgi:hypothetical protein